MGETITVDDGEVTIHDGPRQPQRQPENTGPSITIDDTAPRGDDADAALRRATEQLTAKDRELASARQQAANAQSEAARARDAAARAAAERVTDMKAVLGSAIESADSEIKQARAAKRAARETGDFDAEAAADEAIADALFRKREASGELTRMNAAPPPRQPEPTGNAQPQGADIMSPRARQWIADHPRMDTDPGYRATAIAVHNEMSRAGITEGNDPDRYFAELENAMARVYGQNHGDVPNQGGNTDMRGNGGGHGSSGAPPSRGGGNNGRAQVVSLIDDLGAVRVLEQGARKTVAFVDERTKENMIEGAKICMPGEYMKDPQRAIAEYTWEQVKIARERSSGGSGGMIRTGEGVVYR